jgi:hypothetical protein
MSAKRKNRDGDGADTPQSHGRKKVRIQEARQIPIQAPTHVADGTYSVFWIASLPDAPPERQWQAPCIPRRGKICRGEHCLFSRDAFTNVGSGPKVRNHGYAGFDGEREVILPALTTVYVPDAF